MKTSELTGKALEWAVAKCEGRLGSDRVYISNTCTIAEGKLPEGVITAPESVYDIDVGCLRYSTDWAQGGPIIEREKLHLSEFEGHWTADWYAPKDSKKDGASLGGSTPLIAAMRCYVASKLGYDVEIPKELL